jgi:hypothetical protein
MATSFPAIDDVQRAFIEGQRLFFVASAAARTRVNVSPKPTEALRVIDERTVVYLDLTGSGNETGAHLRSDGRLTFMFCAFEGPPKILRLFGRGQVLERGGSRYMTLLDAHFGSSEPLGARQMVLLEVDLVRTSCGFGVPRYDYVGQRDTLGRWAAAQGEERLRVYRQTKNMESLDGLPTGFHETTPVLHSTES